MNTFAGLIKIDDWKKEKHVPVIECADSVTMGETTEIRVSVGKEIPHPNLTEHHIRWMQLYFLPDGDRFAYQLAGWELAAHGESVAGPNQGCAYTEPSAGVAVTIRKPGVLYALSLCNIHGLWESSKRLTVVTRGGEQG